MTEQEYEEFLQKGSKGCLKNLFWFVFAVFYLIAFAALYNLVRS